MLVMTDPDVPCADTAYLTVDVVPSPNAGFTFSPNGGCAYQDVNFTNTSTGTFSGTTYDWDFGPGPNSSQENPTHQFNGLGTYPVTLTIDNGPGCTSTITQNVNVIDAPNPNIWGDDGDGDLVYCLFPGDTTSIETVTFFNSTTNATTYEWDFGDGSPVYTTGSQSAFNHTYSTYGTFNVTMTATNANGCQTSQTIQVIFEKFVSAALTLNLTEYSGCAPHNMTTLTNLSVNATNYVWDFGDGTVITTSSPTPPAYAYTTAGTYTITLTASNSCNQATATISPIVIIEGPTANFSPSTTSGCAPQNISFSNGSSGTQPANNYQWDMGNGNTYTTTTTPPVQTYANQGYYDVQLVAGNACGYDTAVVTIFIDTIPTVDLVIDPIAGCAPVTVDPTATLLSGTNVNWQWYVDGGYYSSAPNDIPNQTFGSSNPNDSTLHSIQLNVYNNCGSDSDIQTMYVNPPVIAGFTTQDTLCIGQTSTFTNTSTGTDLTYSWDFGDGSPMSTDTIPMYTYASPGDYIVTLTVTGYCGTDIATFIVTILPYPVIDITPTPTAICAGETVTFTNNSTTEGTYSWNFGPNGIPTSSTLFDPGVVSFSGSGTQNVSFTINHSGCISSDTVTVDVNTIPVPTFTTNPGSGCTPLPVDIENTTVDQVGNTYTWDYGNGTSDNNYVPTDQIYLSGILDTTYTIQLIVSTIAGCTDSISQNVTVYPLPTADFTILDDTICSGQSMLFANNSVSASSYLWDFGDGSTTTTTSPSHTYTSNGAFTVTLVAYSGSGCSDTLTTDIFIDSIPTAGFTNTIECLGYPTIFTNTSTGSPVSYEWDFGDGSPLDNTANPSHTYASAGSYLVQLTVTNSVNCTNTIPQLVQVNQVPVADFIWSQTCQGQQMNFTDQTLNNPIGWAWDFGDGGTSLIQNPSHLYLDTGSYTVQLIVSGGSGCLDSISYDVYVDSIPQANFTFAQVCTNDTTVFTDNSIYNPDQYLWDFGDGNISTLTDPDHVYTTSGTYNVTLSVTYSGNGCTNAITQPVEAYPRTVPAFNANTPCLGDSTTFVDMTTNAPMSWNWDFGDGSSGSTQQSPTHLYGAMGFYDITLITENVYGCIDTLVQQIEIYGLPVADFTFTTVCEGANTGFTDNSTDDVAWEWDFGDLSAGSTQENPIHVYPTSGTFDVQLIAFNQYGCSDTTVQSVTVNPNPTAGFFSDTACFGYNTTLTDTSSGTVSWYYDLGDGTNSTTSDPTHVYPADGIYTIEQVVTNIYGCMDSTTVDVLINPQPQAGFTNNTVCALDVVQFNDTTLGNITYWEWDFGDLSAISNDTNPVHIYAVGGLYDVTLVAGNTSGCLDTTTVSVQVYTNPAANFEADTVCFLDVTTFTDLSVDVVPIVSWDYDFGDFINQSTLQNPTYIYQAPGIYPASLTVTNMYGCDSTISINVVVNNIPVAEFDYDTVCWGSPTTFTDISLGTVNTWYWDFGDGDTSTVGPVVQHTYASSGTYLAQMVVDGGSGCTDNIYHAITVIDVLTPVIGAQDTACLYELIQFQDLSVTTSGSITGWSWNFGDGSTSNLQNPQHAYSNAGIYTVTLDVTTSSGCTNTGTYTVEVFDPPVADFSLTIPCEGQPTIFADSSYDANGTIDYWEWDFGDLSPFDYTQNPQHQYGVAGSYPVTLIVASSNGCYDTVQQTAVINPAPTADFTFGLECGGVPIDIVNTSSGNIVDYEWIYNGTTIGTTEDITYTFPTDTDTHPVTLVVTTNLGCIDTITQDVITRPVVVFDFGPDVTAGCPVMEVNFADNSVATSGGSIVNWLWDMGDSTYSFTQNPTHYYEDEGTYYISLQVITDEDCVYSDTLMYGIIVYPQPTADFYYAPHTINILNAEVEFTNTSSGAINVEWDFGDYDYSNDWDPVHLYEDTGYFMITQTVYNEFGCSDTTYQTLHVDGNIVVYVPTAFTPDGDGINPTFNMSGYGFIRYELLIFNRWGQLLRTVTDPADGWDGTYRGEACQDGVYTWKLRVVDFEEIPHEYVGHVTLIR